MNLSELRQRYYLDKDVHPLLDSIQWQYEQAGINPKTINRDLNYVCKIAERYITQSEKLRVLQKLDKAIEEHFKRQKAGLEVGSLRKLNDREDELRSKGVIFTSRTFQKRLDDLFLEK